jgi:hypothetical protein
MSNVFENLDMSKILFILGSRLSLFLRDIELKALYEEIG